MDIEIEQNVMVPMRDGVRLATDIYRPAGAGRWPVLLTRVPYDKDLRFPGDARRVFLELILEVQRVVQAGYVIVAQDTRGTHASEGDFAPFYDEREDGADSIAWAASQPWSSGAVGMFGVSYQGITQWQAAAERPAALRAIAPAQSPALPYPYQGGALWLSVMNGWTATQGIPIAVEWRSKRGLAVPDGFVELARAWQEGASPVAHLPRNDSAIFSDLAPYYYEWLAHPDFDEYWRAKVTTDFYQQITVPAFIIAGWNDFFNSEDLKHYRGLRQDGGSALAREQTRLLVGPWSHGDFWGFFSGGAHMATASASAIDLTGAQLRWFDHWLKGDSAASPQAKNVRLFVLGVEAWRDEDDWPLPDTQYRPFYLHSAGHANTAQGDGSLDTQTAAQEPGDNYRYDPHDPVPSRSPRTQDALEEGQSYDQGEIEQRADVLCYTSQRLEQPLTVIGPVELVLYVSSSALDTDFTGKLVDVHPDGRVDLLTDGILRARYRESLSAPELLTPGQVYELRIDLGATANVFLPGHRVRLEVSSSNFPRFDSNSNSGGVISAECEASFVVAENGVLHDAAHPSRLILPVIERNE